MFVSPQILTGSPPTADTNAIDQITVSIANASLTQSLSVTGGPGGINVSYNAATGVLTMSGTNSLDSDWMLALKLVTFNDTSGEPGSVEVRATNLDNGATHADTQNIAVVQVNDAPTTTPGGPYTLAENGAQIIAAVHADPDANDSLSFTFGSYTGLGGTAIDNGDGTFSFDPGTAFDSLDAGSPASAVSFDYTVNDGNGGTSGTHTVNLSIVGANEEITGTAVNDVLVGTAYADNIYGLAGKDNLSGMVGGDVLRGSTGSDKMYGGDDNDKLLGGQGNDKLFGGLGNDELKGHVGNDKLTGGLGQDTMTGGEGNDTFIFNAVAESDGVTFLDEITDFTVGVDRIDLSAIDAITSGFGSINDTFVFVGTLAFSAEGQVRAYEVSGGTVVSVNVNSTPLPEMEIFLAGVSAASLTASDFIL